jgi:hypothetical protein
MTSEATWLQPARNLDLVEPEDDRAVGIADLGTRGREVDLGICVRPGPCESAFDFHGCLFFPVPVAVIRTLLGDPAPRSIPFGARTSPLSQATAIPVAQGLRGAKLVAILVLEVDPLPLPGCAICCGASPGRHKLT